MTRSTILTGALASLLLAAPVASFAAPSGMVHSPAPVSATGANPPTNPNTRSGNALGHPGAPAVSCQAIGVTPGNASGSPGSPFNEPVPGVSAGGNAGLHYAGNVPQSQKNTASVSQYDVACANAAAH